MEQSLPSTVLGNTRKNVSIALRMMRKSHTKRSRSQRELAKYNSDSTATTSPKKYAEGNILYDESHPFHFKNMNDLIKDAKVNYSLKVERKKFELASRKLGKPRPIYTDLVKEIVKEELASAAMASAAAINTIRKGSLRPLSAPNMLNRNTISNSKDINKDEVKTRNNNKNSDEPEIELQKTIDNNKKNINDCNVLEKMPAIINRTKGSARRESVIDMKIRKAQENRLAINGKIEGEKLKKLNDRHARQTNRMESARSIELQYKTAVIVSITAWMHPLISLLQQKRKEEHEKKFSSKKQRAVSRIENWWWKSAIHLKLKRNPEVANTLAFAFRHIWGIFNRYKRRTALMLLKQFIKDTTGLSDKVRKIYKFRSRILFLQRYVRSWLLIQQTRLQIMWLSMEKIVKKRSEILRLEKITNEKASLKAMAGMQGFGGTLVEIDTVKKSINNLLEHQKRIMKRVIAQQLEEDREVEELESSFHPSHTQNKKYLKTELAASNNSAYAHATKPGLSGTNTTANSNNVVGASNGNGNGPGGSGSGTTGKKKEHTNRRRIGGWYGKFKANPLNANKLHILMSILTEQRRRHIITVNETSRRKKMGEAKVDMNELKKFLSNPYENNVDPISLADHNDSGDPSGHCSSSSNPFLLLTLGGLQSLDAVPTSRWQRKE